MAEQIAYLGALATLYVLQHGGSVVGGGGDHRLDFLLQPLGRRGESHGFQQGGEFIAQRRHLCGMAAQLAIATAVQHGQRIDGAVDRQLAPQAGVDVIRPVHGNAQRGEGVQPGRRYLAAELVADPGLAGAGRHHMEVGFAKGALGGAGSQAAHPGNPRRHCVLAAEAVLQEQDLGLRLQARGDAGDGFLGVVALAGQQQPANRIACLGRFGGQRIEAGDLALGEVQAALGAVLRQARAIAQDQPYRFATAKQASGPESAETAGAQHMPAHECDSNVDSLRMVGFLRKRASRYNGRSCRSVKAAPS